MDKVFLLILREKKEANVKNLWFEVNIPIRNSPFMLPSVSEDLAQPMKSYVV